MDIPTTEQKAPPPITIPAQAEQLDQPYPHLTEAEVEDIFRQALAELPPHLLVRPKTSEERKAERHFLLFTLVLLLSFVAGSVVAIVTYPTVTIALTPVSKRVTYTAQLALPTRTLKPVTVSQRQTTPTTGTGYQPATRATGMLTFYNGLFTPQYIASGTLFTGRDGVTVITTQAAPIPASDPSATPPQPGSTTVSATATQAGAAGNIAAYEINSTVWNGVSVKNISPFQHGRDARAYRAVAQRDLDRVTMTLKQTLRQHIPQAFTLPPGEALYTTQCVFQATPNHQPGAEAQSVTVAAKETCQGLAYNQDQLEQQAMHAFTVQTSPGPQYRLVGTVIPTITGVSPITIYMRGLWVYTLPQSYEQFLAQHIAGDSPTRARAYLLQTGLVVHVSVSQQLPKDPQHIRFLQIIDLSYTTGAGER